MSDSKPEAETGESGDARRTMFNQLAKHNNRHVFTAGFQYILPWLVTADASIDQNGKVRLVLQREDIPITQNKRKLYGKY